MSAQDTVVPQCVQASAQINCWAHVQRGALLFYLIAGYTEESLLMTLKHATTGACKREPAHEWKNVQHTDKRVPPSCKKLHHTQLGDVWKFPLQSWHQVTCSITQGVCYERFLRMWMGTAIFTVTKKNKWSDLTPQNTQVIRSTPTDICWQIKKSPYLT